ncbi:methylenetetrahydrofolate reductase isoform X2 [Frieseomelitta varia]|uniref:methylenetetrahydrofolate reductase isoform X2 n=1 Tax=Frieseomelitta varia TaxID=561572 RepID=UPI001CB69A7C|nr:methylenetetrahydrofolate reductase isoform X2 [Frieseomelitta varia]
MIDLRKTLKDIINTNAISCSFEIMRVKNNDFYQRFFAEVNKYHPSFYTLTWHIKNDMKDYLSLDVFNALPNNTLLHLIANNLTPTDVKIILKKALERDIRNIFVLRGVDLVRFIRNQFDDIFCICVAGYPEMHPESSSKEMDLIYLKEKIDAGADFIITQIVFEANIFIKFVNDCKKIGINVPIIPGIFPILNYMCLQKMAKICNIKVPKIILNTLECIKDNNEKVHNYAVEIATNIIKEIIASKTTCGFHFFTLNKPSLSLEICDKLGIFC